MRIAVISDIHGNLAALDAVLAHARAMRVDQTVNLGDIVSGGLFPAETADRLMTLGFPTIAGNHERQLLGLSVPTMGLSDSHAAATLRSDQLDWLRSLPTSIRLLEDILLVHGAPGNDLTYLLDTVTDHGLREATVVEIQERLGETTAAVILCGHTHIARVVRLPDGPLIVNPGSVGLPAYEDHAPFPHVVEAGTPHARYAVLEHLDNQWEARLHVVAYDWEKAARDAQAHGRDDWVRPLRIGRI